MKVVLFFLGLTIAVSCGIDFDGRKEKEKQSKETIYKCDDDCKDKPEYPGYPIPPVPCEEPKEDEKKPYPQPQITIDNNNTNDNDNDNTNQNSDYEIFIGGVKYVCKKSYKCEDRPPIDQKPPQKKKWCHPFFKCS